MARPAGVESPSMVVIWRPAAAATGVMQERVGCPSMWTVHAPQSDMPQPNFVPVNARWSRSAQRSGMSGSTSSSRACPLTVSRMLMGSPPAVRPPIGILDSSRARRPPAIPRWREHRRPLGGLTGLRRRQHLAEAALPARIVGECRPELRLAEVRPQPVGEVELRIGAVPEEEIGQPLLAAGADQQV